MSNIKFKIQYSCDFIVSWLTANDDSWQSLSRDIANNDEVGQYLLQNLDYAIDKFVTDCEKSYLELGYDVTFEQQSVYDFNVYSEEWLDETPDEAEWIDYYWNQTVGHVDATGFDEAYDELKKYLED